MNGLTAAVDDHSTAAGGLDGDELDALQELGDEIATLAAHVHAAMHRLLTLIVEFDGGAAGK